MEKEKIQYSNYANGENCKKFPLDIELIDVNGGFENYYKITKSLSKKIILKDLINSHINSLESCIQNNSSGDSARIGSSGDYAQIGSSGDYAQIGSSGYGAKIGSSGYGAKIGSSGDFTQIGSSGDSARIGSSGHSARIGSSGDLAQIGSSGNSARISSSGDSTQIGSSGDFTRIGSSGNSARICVKGNNSIVFGCGVCSMVKATNGTWLSLAEYRFDKNRYIYIPYFAKVGQIGNKKYKDCFGNVLNDSNYYQLIKKKFTPVLDVDKEIMVILQTGKLKDYHVYKTQFIEDFVSNNQYKQIVVSKDYNGETYYAHGENTREAIKDVNFKIASKNFNQEEIANKIKEKGFIDWYDYRLITGSCEYGTKKWLEENNFTTASTMSIKTFYENYKDKKIYCFDRFSKFYKTYFE